MSDKIYDKAKATPTTGSKLAAKQSAATAPDDPGRGTRPRVSR